MFMSLDVLHHPEAYGLRRAWAAGVRSRLPVVEREILQQIQMAVSKGSFYWIYNLPAPKDGATVLNALERLPPAERLRSLIVYPYMPLAIREVFEQVSVRQSWTEPDFKTIRSEYQDANLSRKYITDLLEAWSNTQELSLSCLEVLQVYYDVFFAEEEVRIRPALEAAVNRAQKLARKLDLPALLAELSEGFHFGEALPVAELVLVPSFWITPLVAHAQVTAERILFLFGGRPPDASLVPGEVVPDALFRGLKALSDPTRLRILHYLTAEPLTPAQLSRRLRLRAPTVVHHLRTLRLAGLVHLTLEAGKKVHYTTRSEAVTGVFAALQDFLVKETPRR
jgi:DNA-binding transcriptional ArsR family regulator